MALFTASGGILALSIMPTNLVCYENDYFPANNLAAAEITA